MAIKARVVWKKGPRWKEKRNAEAQRRDLLRFSFSGVVVRARVVKEVWWLVEYAEKGR